MTTDCTGETLEILVADDDVAIHGQLTDWFGRRGHRVKAVTDGWAVMEAVKERIFDLVVLDIEIPGLDGLEVLRRLHEHPTRPPVAIMTGHATVDRAVTALRLGAVDFLTKPAVGETVDRLLTRIAERQVDAVPAPVPGSTSGGEPLIVGCSPAMQRARADVVRAVQAGVDAILVVGATGTGKEVVARAIHRCMGKERPFVAVSCPSLPESLIERELFGHERGAFTGADRAIPGYIELADGGVLFLDEVGDLSAAAQASLLRVLETRELRRVGGTRDIAVATTVVAAANAPLAQLIVEHRFRSDLFYRLNHYTIELPPLCERPEDVPPLVEHFLVCNAARHRRPASRLSVAAMACLQAYGYPGNVRELRTIVEQAIIASRCAEVIEAEQVRPLLSSLTAPARACAGPDEAARIQQALEATHWNRRKAAQMLGMAYSTLRYKIRLFGLK